ncbi:hypothetical protein [Leucobacter denitrificans]|uniref:DUF4926 domain-containing protein n=1 Tax=Leucobacter denitrificans TaxID=683042 RepID=A0A7G9S348_9MICO|nr:hypothetical protein [Leucobacter denitrificans]QNN62273.1 hypothetical protein H9L06_08270 [Leucobacter denitrificans]
MDETPGFQVGDSVVGVAGVRGTIADISTMSNGETVYGIVDTTGAVRYFTAAALKQVIS